MRVYRGEAISPGVALGTIHVYNDILYTDAPKKTVLPEQIPLERERLARALDEARAEIRFLVQKVHQDIGVSESNIFQTHLMILDDRTFVGEMLRLVEKESLGAESAVRLVVEHWERTFAMSASPQLQMKAYDIVDIGKRVLSKLAFESSAGSGIGLKHGQTNIILATRLLLPSITAFIDKNQVLGIVAELGNKASHSAVIAKSLGLPAVFGVPNIMKTLQQGDEVIVDGSAGIVYVNPDAAVRKEFETFRRKYSGYLKKLESLTGVPSVTLDGRNVDLYANIGALADAELTLKYQAKGVGLYRTEMPFIIRNDFPDEDLQYSIYRKVIEKLPGRPIYIRTLDLGGDKMSSFFPMPKEENPNLGWRAIRVFIDNPQFFKVQLRAILRAAVGADVRLILPMISDITEVRISKKILAEAKRELIKKNIPFNNDVQLGVMVEVPSAVILAEHLIDEADFFSVGTNDLIQYTLAVDRASEKASRYFEPLNPAVLHMLKSLADVANRAGKDISVCGEVASDPYYIPILIGFGYQKLSVSPLALNMVKDIVRATRYDQARNIAREVMIKKTVPEIRAVMDGFFAQLKTQFKIESARPASMKVH